MTSKLEKQFCSWNIKFCGWGAGFRLPGLPVPLDPPLKGWPLRSHFHSQYQFVSVTFRRHTHKAILLICQEQITRFGVYAPTPMRKCRTLLFLQGKKIERCPGYSETHSPSGPSSEWIDATLAYPANLDPGSQNSEKNGASGGWSLVGINLCPSHPSPRTRSCIRQKAAVDV